MFVGEAIFGGRYCVSTATASSSSIFRAHAAALIAGTGNEPINLGGGLGNRYAIMFAPLSIAQAISSTTILFVFMFGVLLSLLSRNLAARRCRTAAVLVALGVALVTR
jgi:hypothetical protein